MISQNVNISPIIARTRTCKHFYAFWQQGHQLVIPTTHFTPRVPKGSAYSLEIAPFLFSKCLHECSALSFLEGWSDDGEFGRKAVEDINVVLNGVANVEDYRFRHFVFYLLYASCKYLTKSLDLSLEFVWEGDVERHCALYAVQKLQCPIQVWSTFVPNLDNSRHTTWNIFRGFTCELS